VGQRYGSTSVTEWICTKGQAKECGYSIAERKEGRVDATIRNVYPEKQREGRIQSAERAVPTLRKNLKVTNLLSA
jgi:hypothetical protein